MKDEPQSRADAGMAFREILKQAEYRGAVKAMRKLHAEITGTAVDNKDASGVKYVAKLIEFSYPVGRL